MARILKSEKAYSTEPKTLTFAALMAIRAAEKVRIQTTPGTWGYQSRM